MASFRYLHLPVPTVRRRLALIDQLTRAELIVNEVKSHTPSHFGVGVSTGPAALVLDVVRSVVAAVASGMSMLTAKTETCRTFCLTGVDREGEVRIHTIAVPQRCFT